MTIIGIAVHFSAIEAKNRLHRTFQAMANERNVEDPVKERVRVFHLHEKVREEHERADEETPENESEFDVHHRAGDQAKALRGETYN